MPVTTLTSPVLVESKMADLLINHPDFSNRIVDLAVAAITLTRQKHADRVMTMNRAAGVTATLPAATGSGERYTFYVRTTVTSNAIIIKVANTIDVINGTAWQAADTDSSVVAWEAAATDDTISMNGSTTGGIKGDKIELIDAAAGLWLCQAFIQGTGTEATPFSATVS